MLHMFLYPHAYFIVQVYSCVFVFLFRHSCIVTFCIESDYLVICLSLYCYSAVVNYLSLYHLTILFVLHTFYT